MKRFLQHLVPFAALQAVIAMVLFGLYHPSPHHIMASTIDKHRLFDETPSPRLVLVGGSSVLFGVISDTLAARLPFRPVNMSLTAGLGTGFILNEVRDGLRPGDVAVVSAEYEQFGNSMRPAVVLRLLTSSPSSVRYVPLDYAPALLDFGVSYAGIVVRGAIDGLGGWREPLHLPNVRDALNRFGDDSLRTATDRVRQFELEIYPGGTLPRRFGGVLGELNRFADACRRRGVHVYFMHPPVPATRWRLRGHEIAMAESVFVRRMRMPMLDTARDLVFPDSSFYDTEYHLTQGGAALRTQMLARALTSRLAADTARTGTP